MGKGFLPGKECGTEDKPLATIYTVNPDTGVANRWVGPYMDAEVTAEADAWEAT